MRASRWAARLEMRRKGKDKYFRDNFESPIPPQERETFEGLNYYPLEPSLRFEIELHEHAEKKKIRVAATHGEHRDLLRWGEFRCRIGEVECTLQAYRSDPSSEGLFVPFRDGNAGVETYEHGRYLDLEPSLHHMLDGKWILDFNEATNPWCEYSQNYVCPYAPRENWIDVPVPAGEKKFRT